MKKKSMHTKQWLGTKGIINKKWMHRLGYMRDYGSKERNEAVYGPMKKADRSVREKEGGDGHGAQDEGVKVFAPRGESFNEVKHALKKGLGSGMFKDKMKTGKFHKKNGGTGVLR